jgi:hypothetical protein
MPASGEPIVQPPPLATHLPPEQQPSLQELSAQQGAPNSPQLAQIPAMHSVPGAVHATVPRLSPQHCRPGAPQLPHAPALHIPPPSPTQLLPTAMQIPETQHPPLLQLLPWQHGVPGPPQAGTLPPSSPPCAPPTPPWPEPPLPKLRPPTPVCVPPPVLSPPTCDPPSPKLAPDFDPPHAWTEVTIPPASKHRPNTLARLLEVTWILLIEVQQDTGFSPRP